MTDPQLTNNNSSSNNNNNNNTTASNNNNNNNDGEPKYLHKKFKKMATTEVSAPLESNKMETGVSMRENNGSVAISGPVIQAPSPELSSTRKRDSARDQTATAAIVIESSRTESPESENAAAVAATCDARKTGYVCPYCKLSCAKPSVLQKHIRAHTNERPYPCVPCGFAFKTKSNLYKHCRSRAHALKMEGGDAGKISEDSDISLSDSASNGTGTPPPSAPATSHPATSCAKTIKTGKIYKPKFHTGLHCVNNNNNNNESDAASTLTTATTTTTTTTTLISPPTSLVGSLAASSNAKPNAEQLQEHIDKIITDNQAIVDAIDPRLHKLVHRQQSLVETTRNAEQQPLNLSSIEECQYQEPIDPTSSMRKRCYSDSFAQETRHDNPKNPETSIIKDLLLKTRSTVNENENNPTENFFCPSCKIGYASHENLEAHRRYYCKSNATSPGLPDFRLVLEKRDDYDITAGARINDFYGTVQPLPSPGPLLGNTRLVDAYAPPPIKKQRSESVPTSLRSLEELSKYPRPNSLQMFGGEVRILENTGETKTMRIEPRQSGTPPSEHIVTCGNKCAMTETSSIVVRSGLHSGGTIVHKPTSNGVTLTTNSSPDATAISLVNAPKILAPIIPNISTPSLAPTVSRYNYLEPHLNPLTSITAYNPLTLPQQPGIASILHAGKVIPYVPGMPGPQTLNGNHETSAQPDDSSAASSSACGLETPMYKIIPGMPGLHVVAQPLDLASPSRVQTPATSAVLPPGPIASPEIHRRAVVQPLDLATPPKDSKNNVRSATDAKQSRHPDNTLDKFRAQRNSMGDRNEERQTRNVPPKFKVSMDAARRESDKCGKSEHPNGIDNETNTCGKRYSAKSEARKRPASWSLNELENPRSYVETSGDNSSPCFAESRDERNESDSRTVLESEATNSGLSNATRFRIGDTSPRRNVTEALDSPVNVGGASRAETKRNSDEEFGHGEETTTKFLRPTSLPLKPGTFTPKRHHGITPTANTLPLISPETPRPKKSYGQLYLNGHAYTYLGLKCSTRVFYCTVNRPQPMYVTQQHGLSMYSNWKICKETPLDLDMAQYDSRHRPPEYTVAWKKQDDILTHSSQRPNTPTSPDSGLESDTQEKTRRVKIFDGGFESNEDYTYVRGRGRGRYVCEECGIRCKKPSMLKKHIRTHTDVRPYTCKHCTFSFKTKGNLTKHMKSKAHYKKCVELGVVPVPTSVCDENIDKEAIARLVAGGGNADDTSDDEDEDSEGDESDESGSEEHEAAQSLLSLSQRSSNRLPGLLPTGRPTTYPYALTFPAATCVTQSLVSTTCATSGATVVTAASTTSVSSTSVSSAATMIQSEQTNRYYFPSSREPPSLSMTEERRDSVIRTSRKSEESDIEIEDDTTMDSRIQQSVQQPMDLTTRQTSQLTSPVVQRPSATDILTPVSEPVLMQTIVQTMERLPLQGGCPSGEWKAETADGQMLQAYLTERHVMDSKMKQQYRVGATNQLINNRSNPSPVSHQDRPDNDREIYTRQMEFMNSRNTESSSTPTVTYTNPSRLHQSYLEMRTKTKHGSPEETKLETKEVCHNDRRYEPKTHQLEKDRSPYADVETTRHFNLSIANRANNEQRNALAKNSIGDRSGFIPIETPRDSCTDRQSSVASFVDNRTIGSSRNDERATIFNALKTIEIERSREANNHHQHHHHHPDYRSLNHPEARSSPRSHENGTNTTNSRPPSRETRNNCQDYRPSQSAQIYHEGRNASSQEFKLPSQELRPPSREFKSPCQNETRSVVQESHVAPPTVNNNVSVVVVLDHQRHPILDTRSPNARDTVRPVNDHREISRQNYETPNLSGVHQEANKIHEIQARLARSPVETRNELATAEAKRHEIERAKQSINESVKHTVARKMVVGGPGFRSPSPPGALKPQAEFLQPSSGPAPNYVSVTEDGRSVCGICNKVFSKPSQLRLHINIHYFERPFRCESCAVSFRTKGHLTKHERSVSHHNKVSMTSTFGAATTSNPRPFKCTDCKIAFRIHGHLAKHLRSKMHIMKLECLGKLPFGTYAEMERSGVNLNDIDTTDCDNSLTSLQILAQKLYEKDPSKMGQWDAEMMIPHQGASGGETSSDEGEPIPPPLHHQYHPGLPQQQQQQQQQQQLNHEGDQTRAYHHNAQQQQPILLDESSKLSRFSSQRVEYASRTSVAPVTPCCDNSHDNSRVHHEIAESQHQQQQLPYKCQICAISVRTVNELQVHRFVEHNNMESPTGNAIVDDNSHGKRNMEDS